jgi:hypothetical protein
MVPADPEPPRHLRYNLDEALELLAVLEDACVALVESGHLAGVLELEAQVRELSRRLGFDSPEGGDDER